MAPVGARTYLKTHKLKGKVLQFQLREELDALLQRAKESASGRTAKTLVKEGPLRMTLVAMRKGARMNKHHVDGQSTVQALRGRVRLESDTGTADLGPGEVAVFNRGVEHDAIARSDCAFLITMSWHRR